MLLLVYIVERSGRNTESMCREYVGVVSDGCIRSLYDLRKVLCWLALDDGGGERVVPGECPGRGD